MTLDQIEMARLKRIIALLDQKIEQSCISITEAKDREEKLIRFFYEYSKVFNELNSSDIYKRAWLEELK